MVRPPPPLSPPPAGEGNRGVVSTLRGVCGAGQKVLAERSALMSHGRRAASRQGVCVAGGELARRGCMPLLVRAGTGAVCQGVAASMSWIRMGPPRP